MSSKTVEEPCKLCEELFPIEELYAVNLDENPIKEFICENCLAKSRGD